MTEAEVLRLVRRVVQGARVELSFHAEIEKALETYDLWRADVLHVLEHGEQAIADGARPTIWTIVGRVQADQADNGTQNRLWAVVVDIDGDVFVRTIHGYP